MTEFEFMLSDRIAKIKSINEQYNLENNAYISFSGGKDSTVLSALVDLALPNNKIPRVFINTGIEYKDIVDFVKQEQKKDDRIVIVAPAKNVRETLETYGYPFKSKEHSDRVLIYQNSGLTDYIKKYLGLEIAGKKYNKRWQCLDKLRYQFTENFNLKISKKCCYKLKKDPAKKWEKENNRKIVLTGMRAEEGENRRNIKCIAFEGNSLKKFHPLLVVDDNFLTEFITKYKIELCKLYYPPFSFERTGCKGCPYNQKLQQQLDLMEKLLPAEKKQCEIIWRPVYDEYRRIGYRLKK